MVVRGTRLSLHLWKTAAAATSADLDAEVSSVSEAIFTSDEVLSDNSSSVYSDANLGFEDRALSAAGAPVVSAIIVYPLDLAEAFQETQNGFKPPGVLKFENAIEMSTNSLQRFQSYSILWTGLGAQLARNVPFCNHMINP